MEAVRVLVAMSGGVDSSVAAALLKEQGHELVGVTLHLWDASGNAKVGRCCAPEDREDARKSADELGFPHYTIDERAPRWWSPSSTPTWAAPRPLPAWPATST